MPIGNTRVKNTYLCVSSGFQELQKLTQSLTLSHRVYSAWIHFEILFSSRNKISTNFVRLVVLIYDLRILDQSLMHLLNISYVLILT